MLPIPLTRGLKNENNTCYVNAALQILARSPSITNWSEEYVHCSGDPPEDCIKCIVRNTILEMKKVPWNEPIVPNEFLRWIREHNPTFAAGAQGDPHELMSFVMQQTGFEFFDHEEMEKAMRDVEGNVDVEICTIIPPGIGLRMALRQDTLTDISIRTLLDLYWSIGNSKICYESGRKNCIERGAASTPEMLVIILDRFVLENNVWTKNLSPCYINREVSIINQMKEEVTYRRYAVIEHRGDSPIEGHYIAKVFDNGRWLSYSDEHIKHAEINNEYAYMVFYTKLSEDVIPDVLSDLQEDIIFDQEEIESIEESFVDSDGISNSSSDHADDLEFGSEKHEEYVQSWRKEFSEKIHNAWLTKSRLLVLCIPKTCEGSSFEESYGKFQNSNETLLYTVTYTSAAFLANIRKDPYIKENYNVYAKAIGGKILDKSVSMWVAEAAIMYILNTLYSTGLPKYEFFFDTNPRCLITQFIVRNWEEIRRRVSPDVDRSLDNNNLFCLEGCSAKCADDNKAFHRSIYGMTSILPADETAEETQLHRWRFSNLPWQTTHHPLRNLMSRSDINCTEDIPPQIVTFLNNCIVKSTQHCNVYLLMVVDSTDPHTPEQLYDMWLRNTATFSVYVGLTTQGIFRKSHLSSNSPEKYGPVANLLSDKSTVYLVASKEFSTFTAGAVSEAQLIAVLRLFQEEEKKTGIDYKFKILNKNLPTDQLFESTSEMKSKYDDFIEKGKPPFRFIHEPYEQTEDENGILQRFLVFDVVRKHMMDNDTFHCDFPECEQTYGRSDQLFRHQQSHMDLEFKCDFPECEKMFSRRDSLMFHMRKHKDNLFDCQYPSCSESFSTYEDLRKHKTIHFDELFTCGFPNCNRSYAIYDSLLAHKLQHNDNTYACDFPNCKKTFRLYSSLYAHKRKHSDEQHFCDFPECLQSFLLKGDLISHKRSHIDGEFKCDFPQCDRAFSRSDTLLNHRRTHTENVFQCEHEGCTASFPTRKAFRAHQRSHRDTINYDCDFPGCTESFTHQKALWTHRRSHKDEMKYDCNFPGCSASFDDNQALRKHGETHRTTRLPCDYPGCSKSYTHMNSLLNHKRKHKDNIFECEHPGCPESFPTKEAVMTHRRCHLDRINYDCDFLGCDESFENIKDLRTHKRSHKETKEYECEVCKKCFLTTWGLYQHRRQHEGKRFKCTVCNKEVLTRAGLVSHMQVHSKKIYKCQVCGKECSTHILLWHHSRIHDKVKGYKCSVCGKGFSRATLLSAHQTVHESVKRFKCDHCDKEYFSQSSLCRHIKTHKEIPFHKCDVCHKLFIRQSDLDRHKREHE